MGHLQNTTQRNCVYVLVHFCKICIIPKKHTCKACVCTHKNHGRPAFSIQGHSRMNRAFIESKYVPIPCHYGCSKEKTPVCSCDRRKESEEKGKGGPRATKCLAVAVLSSSHSPLAIQQLCKMVLQYLNKLVSQRQDINYNFECSLVFMTVHREYIAECLQPNRKMNKFKAQQSIL